MEMVEGSRFDSNRRLVYRATLAQVDIPLAGPLMCSSLEGMTRLDHTEAPGAHSVDLVRVVVKDRLHEPGTAGSVLLDARAAGYDVRVRKIEGFANSDSVVQVALGARVHLWSRYAWLRVSKILLRAYVSCDLSYTD